MDSIKKGYVERYQKLTIKLPGVEGGLGVLFDVSTDGKTVIKGFSNPRAAEYGLKPRDIVVSINGMTVTSQQAFIKMMQDLRGLPTRFVVYRPQEKTAVAVCDEYAVEDKNVDVVERTVVERYTETVPTTARVVEKTTVVETTPRDRVITSVASPRTVRASTFGTRAALQDAKECTRVRCPGQVDELLVMLEQLKGLVIDQRDASDPETLNYVGGCLAHGKFLLQLLDTEGADVVRNKELHALYAEVEREFELVSEEVARLNALVEAEQDDVEAAKKAKRAAERRYEDAVVELRKIDARLLEMTDELRELKGKADLDNELLRRELAALKIQFSKSEDRCNIWEKRYQNANGKFRMLTGTVGEMVVEAEVEEEKLIDEVAAQPRVSKRF